MFVRRYLVAALVACSLLALPSPASAATHTATVGETFELYVGTVTGARTSGGAAGCQMTFGLVPTYSVVWSDGVVQTPTPVWTRDPSVPGGFSADCTGAVSVSRSFTSAATYTVAATTTTYRLGTNEPQPSTATHTIRVQSGVASGTVAQLNAVAGVAMDARVATIDSGFFAPEADRFLAVVAWGDSTRSLADLSGTDGVFAVTSDHVYATAGTYPVVVTLIDTFKRGMRTDFPGTATVAAAPEQPTPTPTSTPTSAPVPDPTPTPTPEVAPTVPTPVTVPPPVTAPVTRCVVPKLVGLRLGAAKSAIARSSCKLGKVTYVKAARSKAGKVVDAPRVGATFAAGTRLAIKVGK